MLVESSGRRVVVTGLGLVTPLGTTVSRTWTRLLAGDSGLTVVPFPSSTSKPAGMVPRDDHQGFKQRDILKPHDLSLMPEFIQFAVVAAHEALQDAKLSTDINEPNFDPELAGAAIGTGIGSIMDIADSYTKLTSAPSGFRRISPYFVPRILCNMAAGHISMKFGLKGPNHAVSTACATGAHSIGDAYRFIKDGYADIMVAGGTESSINELSVAGFSRCKALSTNFNEFPEQASRPFDAKRDGFVIGEGCGVVVLEHLESALKRGISEEDIYAEVLGYGLSGDAHHITAPDPTCSGAIRSMKTALRNVDPEEIDYVNAHATSTPLGDALEAKAISKVFRYPIAVSSTKGAIGHLLGAAGSVEAIFTILALKHGVIPHTKNLEQVDVMSEGLDLSELENLEFIQHGPKRASIRKALSNSFGFGGTNCSLVFGKLS